MLRALTHTDDGPVLIFGLSAMNISALQEGMPMHFSLDAFGMKGNVMIFVGDTEDSMVAELRAVGLASPISES